MSQSVRTDGETLTSDPCINSVPLSQKLHQKITVNEKFFSLEFFPPKTFNGATNLMAIAGRISEQGKPLFCDISWKSTPLTVTDGESHEPSTLIVAAALSDFHDLDVMMHIPSVHVTKSQVLRELNKAKDVGIRNILALRGVYDQESSVMASEDDDEVDGSFEYTVDLVKFIRDEFDDYFTIAVAGYPRHCATLDDYEQDIRHLKAKVDAGADFVITQMFFEAKTFFDFTKECEKFGINVPIIPGIMPIQSYATLSQLQHHSPVTVPEHLLKAIEPIKHDDSAVMEFGLKHAIDLSQQLLNSKQVPGVHFYTLNREMVATQVLIELGFCQKQEESQDMEDSSKDFLPWLKGLAKKRRGLENVRPIFWASRPRSYLIRTSKWDEFPNGRWGSSSAASFGELKDYHLFFLGNKRDQQDLRNMWGSKLECAKDVFEVFVCYLTGQTNKQGYKVSIILAQVTELPWNEDALASETIQLVEKLSNINKHGILSINSQPNVNCLPSTHPVVGWGKPGGFIFQKAYLEFFTREEVALALCREIEDKFPSVNYHMVNCKGDEMTNAEGCIAVTWGVFSGSEIIQPTVVDPVTFHLWKDEAFALWKQQWGKLYPEGSTSRQLIDEIHDTYYLVNLVDNDYVAGNCLFDVLDSVLRNLGSIE